MLIWGSWGSNGENQGRIDNSLYEKDFEKDAMKKIHGSCRLGACWNF